MAARGWRPGQATSLRRRHRTLGSPDPPRPARRPSCRARLEFPAGPPRMTDQFLQRFIEGHTRHSATASEGDIRSGRSGIWSGPTRGPAPALPCSGRRQGRVAATAEGGRPVNSPVARRRRSAGVAHETLPTMAACAFGQRQWVRSQGPGHGPGSMSFGVGRTCRRVPRLAIGLGTGPAQGTHAT